MGSTPPPGPLDQFTRIDDLLVTLDKLNANIESLLSSQSGISPPSPGVTFKDQVRQGVREAFIGKYIPFPFKYGEHLMPAATESDPIEIDFVKGETVVPGVGKFEVSSKSLKSVKKDNAISGSVFVDAPITLTLKDQDGHLSGKIHPGGVGFVSFQNNNVALIELSSATPFAVGGTLATGLLAPIIPKPVALGVSRYGHISPTLNNGVPVSFIPSAKTETILHNFKENTVNAAVSNHGTPLLPTSGVSQTSWIIHNPSNNSVDYQIRGYDMQNEQAIADPDVFGSASDPTSLNNYKSLAGGATDYVESGVPLYLREMYAKSTTANAPGELEIQFLGYSPEVR